jgi:L-rhamnose-H+ transport protein
MSPEIIIGLFLAILGGGLQGAFVLPMKYLKKWEWENAWLIFTLINCVIFPVVAAWLFIPDFMEVYSQDGVTSGTMHAVFWFGAGWGVGNILFGLGAKFLGMALGIALITGINCVLGTLFPILFLKPGQFSMMAGLILGAGLLVLIIGVVVISNAGAMREKEMNGNAQPGANNSNVTFAVGLITCVAAGIFCPMMNFSVHFGKPITTVVEGMPSVAAYNTMYAQLVPALLGGSLAQIVYCFYLFKKNNSFKKFFESGTGINWIHSGLMAFFWFFGMAIYALAASKKFLGGTGAIVGWPMFLSATIIVSNMLGVLTREWKGVSRPAFIKMYKGILLLIIAVALSSGSKAYLAEEKEESLLPAVEKMEAGNIHQPVVTQTAPE